MFNGDYVSGSRGDGGGGVVRGAQVLVLAGARGRATPGPPGEPLGTGRGGGVKWRETRTGVVHDEGSETWISSILIELKRARSTPTIIIYYSFHDNCLLSIGMYKNIDLLGLNSLF